MVLPSSNRHYAVNDRTLNLLRKGNIDMGAIIGGSAKPTFSDGDISELLEQETTVILTAVKLKTVKQRPGGAFFSFLSKAIYGLSKYVLFFNRVIEVIIITIVFILLYKQEAYQISNYRNYY